MTSIFERLKVAARRAGLIMVVTTLAACGTFEKDETVNWDADKLYSEARLELSASNYQRARDLYQKLESRFPFGRHAQQAQMEIAYTYFKEGESAQAIQAADRFIRLYPNHPNVDYVYYLKGLASFNEDLGFLGRFTTQDLSERDAKAGREAFDSLRDLVNRYPDSRYAEDARARMRYLVNALARSEVRIAQFYLDRRSYIAAVGRAQTVVRDFQTAPAVEDALVITIRAYGALGMDELRGDAERVLAANFPQSRFIAASK